VNSSISSAMAPLVLLHPSLDVVLGREVADPARAVLRAGDVAGQLVGQVGDPVDQRIAELVSQDGEDHQGREGDDRHRVAPARDPPLQQDHDRVEQQRDEPGHDDQQHDVTQPVNQLAGQVGGRHHGDCHHDRPQRDVPQLGGLPQAR
jgi:hypothetical protein